MRPFATLTPILLAGALSSAAFAGTTIDGIKVPVPTPRPDVMEFAQATGGSKAHSGELAKPGAGDTQPDTVTTGSIAPDVFGIEDYKAIDLTKIAVMRVDELSDESAREQYRRMVDGKSAEVRKLQQAIRTNPDLVAALEDKQVAVDHIISVRPAGDGSVTFIVM
ncbi:hypothetical protein [Mycoplana dimorpha]|uniref:Uncharacterized protein n=1 Tax=Mycoplana dimorpha TaxID=28320 RepID=A0A2T5AZ94_MYCDI|nr:hypothetical protein [Mycoplana dimorpha]PTM92029.1 hypothetical protein C7449_10876 [Mycoplana dimorpha]